MENGVAGIVCQELPDPLAVCPTRSPASGSPRDRTCADMACHVIDTPRHAFEPSFLELTNIL